MTISKADRYKESLAPRFLAWAILFLCIPWQGNNTQAADRAKVQPVSSEEYVAGKPLNIGNEWALLADDYVVEDKKGSIRVMGHAIKLPNSPVLLADLLWESAVGLPNVIYDEKTGWFHMWYASGNLAAWQSKSSWGKGHLAKEFQAKNWCTDWVAYARSRDGMHWEKPMLDLYPYAGFNKTNIVVAGDPSAQSASVWLNDDQSDPERRFLMTYAELLPDPGKGQSLMLRYSADEIHWHIDEAASPLLTHIPDGSFQTLFDKAKGCWLLFRRPDQYSAALVSDGPWAAANTKRRYAVSTNDHLGLGWTYPRIVLVPDEEVEFPDIDHMRVVRYGTHYIGLLGMMDDGQAGLQQVQLALSPDGLRWTQFPYLPPLLPRGHDGAFDTGQVQPAFVVDRGEFSYLYYAGCNIGQRVQQGYYCSIGVARLPKSRWIGLKSDPTGGYVLTREVVMNGDHLEVNFQRINAPYQKPIEGKPLGYLRIELLRRSGPAVKLQEIPGFTFKESDPLVGDNLAGVATWNGNADLKSLRGTPVYVRFYVVNSELWAFRFAAE